MFGKNKPSLIISAILSFTPLGSYAVGPGDPSQASAQETTDAVNQIAEYLKNLGLYQGFDLTQAPKNEQLLSASATDPSAPANPLLDLSIMQSNYLQSFNSGLGARPVSTYAPELMPFVPSNYPLAPLNSFFANLVYKGSTSPDQNQTSQPTWLNPVIDQKNYQADPVSQAILNIIGTPPADGACPTSSFMGAGNKPCPLNRDQVIQNISGGIPSEICFFDYRYNQLFLSQLNSNTLIGPLLYSTDQINSQRNDDNGGSCPPPTGPQFLPKTQMEQAASFVRYASSGTLPFELPSKALYSKYTMRINTQAAGAPEAAAALNTYLSELRVYTSQVSVAISNLYSIYAKRLPQKDPNSNTTPTSQSLSEFVLATWRLFNIDPKANWLTQINGASSDTLNKEMATLLAEINYQMYLNRQIQEKILLTNTMILMQLAKKNQPQLPELDGG